MRFRNDLAYLFSAVAFVSGSYQVPLPANQAQLQPFAKFPVPSIEEIVDGNQVTLSYVLPAELVGPEANPVTLSGTLVQSEPLHLQGANAQASCVPDSNGLNAVCQVRYSGLAVDESRVSEFLSQEVANPVELQSRLAVSKLFSSDPVGVLVYPIAR